MKRLLVAAVVLAAVVALARPKSESQAIILLNGTPSSPVLTAVTDGGLGTLGAASPGDAVRFQCDGPVRYVVGGNPDGGNAEYVATQDPRVFFLPDTATSVVFSPVDGGATCIRWVLR